MLQPLYANTPLQELPLHQALLHRTLLNQLPQAPSHLNHHPRNDLDFVEYVAKLDTTLALSRTHEFYRTDTTAAGETVLME